MDGESSSDQEDQEACLQELLGGIMFQQEWTEEDEDAPENAASARVLAVPWVSNMIVLERSKTCA